MDWSDVPCKLWEGAKETNGYGERRIAGRNYRVHRLAWVEANGPIPPETPYVLHRCDVRHCYELAHLWLGTHQDNMDDMLAKGRHHNATKTYCVNGHEFTEANTYYRKCGRRACRTCVRDRKRTLADRRRARA